MRYYELKLSFPEVVEEDDMEIYIAEMGELGFESFTSDNGILCGYINDKEYKVFKLDIEDYLNKLGKDLIKHEFTLTQEQNWNELWESNFEPIYIEKRCCIRAPFHQKSDCKYEIIIMPKMSFGTGHHATTYLMVEKILDSDFKGKKGLDMGAGTGVLAIAALMRGAEFMSAVDIDEWAEENCRENAATNGMTEKMLIVCGDASALRGENYDFILANINRNILINDMSIYVEHLNEGGDIFFSGFLAPDVEDIIEKATSLDMKHIETRSKDGWQLVHVKKS